MKSSSWLALIFLALFSVLVAAKEILFICNINWETGIFKGEKYQYHQIQLKNSRL